MEMSVATISSTSSIEQLWRHRWHSPNAVGNDGRLMDQSAHIHWLQWPGPELWSFLISGRATPTPGNLSSKEKSLTPN